METPSLSLTESNLAAYLNRQTSHTMARADNQLNAIDHNTATSSKLGSCDDDSTSAPVTRTEDIPYEGDKYEAKYIASLDLWECGHPGCFKRTPFKDLKKHRKDMHDCCLVCDLDFPSWDAYHDHKLTSDDHIVCPICSQDFRSNHGKVRHIKQASRGAAPYTGRLVC